jgi:hypothetical protein
MVDKSSPKNRHERSDRSLLRTTEQKSLPAETGSGAKPEQRLREAPQEPARELT